MAAGGYGSFENLLWKRCGVFGLSALSLFAQPPSGAPTFKSAATLVEVTAVVRDAQGKAARGLTADDFQLFDGGKRQTISTFEVEKSQEHEFRWMRSAQSTSGGSGPAGSLLPDRFVAFVFDDQNLTPEQFPQAARAAIRHLSELRPGDRAAVLSTSGRMLLPFTGDRDKLREALSGMGSLDRRATFDVSGLNAEITCKITYLKADWIQNGDAASLHNCVPPAGTPVAVSPIPRRPVTGLSPAVPGEIHQIHLENQVRAFAESIVQAGDRDVQSYFLGLAKVIGIVSHMPGERSIVLLSPGMYIAPRFRGLQDWTIESAVRARVVISGVDPRGVYIRNDPDDPSTFTDTWGLAETNERIGFMENVTSGTGGRFVHGDNDIESAIRRLAATPEFVYLLGFTPSELKLDGRYHALKVVLNSPRGLTVEARRGYYAGVSNEPDAATQVQRQMEGAFFSSREVHDVPVTLQIRSSHKPNVSIVMTAIAQIDLAKFPFRREGGVNRSDLTVGVGLFDQNGNLVKDAWKDVALHPDDGALESLRRSGLEIKSDFDVTPGRYLVRLLVTDRDGQAMGTQSAGVDIRP
jgi:VWFA-related protein